MGNLPGYFSAIPEPTSLTMALIGAVMVGFRALRWRKK